MTSPEPSNRPPHRRNPVAIFLRAAALTGAIVASSAPRAADDAIRVITEALPSLTQGTVQVKAVRPTPAVGIYEVETTAMDVFYVDRTGRYGLIDGRMVDMKDRKDLTIPRLNAVRSIRFEDLPLSLAIKQGNGSKVLAVFEDPTCPVCRPLHKFIAQLKDVTVYHFPLPVVTKEALPITATAWCSPNRAEVWNQAMEGGAVAPAQKPTCDLSALNDIVRAGERLQVNGTPTVFLENGRRLQGAVPPDAFIAALNESAAEMAAAGRSR